jgi:site-specific DNA-adenine methylase
MKLTKTEIEYIIEILQRELINLLNIIKECVEFLKNTEKTEKNSQVHEALKMCNSELKQNVFLIEKFKKSLK